MGCGVQGPTLLEWQNGLLKKAEKPLRALYKRKVKPGPVLDILLSHKLRFLPENRPATKALKAKRKSRKLLEKDAGVLEEASKILEQWRHVLQPYCWPFNLDSRGVKRAADLIRTRKLSQNHRPEKTRIKTCVVELTALSKKECGLPLPGHIGAVVKAAFPDIWKARDEYPGQLRDATRKLLKRKLRGRVTSGPSFKFTESLGTEKILPQDPKVLLGAVSKQLSGLRNPAQTPIKG